MSINNLSAAAVLISSVILGGSLAVYLSRQHRPQSQSLTKGVTSGGESMQPLARKMMSRSAASATGVTGGLKPVSKLIFDNRSLRELPVDSSFNTAQRDVPNAVFALMDPTPLENPHLIAYSKDVAHNLLEIDIESEPLTKVSELLAGNVKTFGRPAAHCYCGHQFGTFAGQLGDGATMYIGEVVNSKHERWEMQWKGAGLTPFSRQADGRKVLRSSVREFLCSEHLHALGIPTTRALSICTSDSTVIRDILYDGHPRRERCAVVIRVCETFLRFGSFEIARPVDPMSGRAGPNFRKGNKDIIKQLVDYTMRNFYPDCTSPEKFVEEVSRRTARLSALWQTTGWCHGVLNTDNMSILGKTLDYGPFGFMERMDLSFICNRSDDGGRYAYSEQPSICLWNCMKLVETLAMAGNVFTQDPKEIASTIRDVYLKEYHDQYRERMCQKLGIQPTADGKSESNLFGDLFDAMNQTAADFTQFFRALAKCDGGLQGIEEDYRQYIAPCLGDVSALQFVSKPKYDPQQMRMLMELINKGKADEVERATGLNAGDVRAEMARLDKYFEMTSWTDRDKARNDKEVWLRWMQRLYTEFDLIKERRTEKMNEVNPRFVLRNHVAQRAIEKAEKGDFAELNKVLEMCINPYKDEDSYWIDPGDGFKYDAPSPGDIENQMCAVSCSS